ncbi:Uncharacterised protein [Mycobacteroides abscessus subsp. massiliense]|nr:Uncharacterised protein [Mycobacteroides abscessus subsp. massiliense]
MLFGDVGRPLLDRARLHLYGETATLADQVMVMAVRAAPVHRLAGVVAQHIHLTRCRHRLQGAVDGGQADALTVALELVV